MELDLFIQRATPVIANLGILTLIAWVVSARLSALIEGKQQLRNQLAMSLLFSLSATLLMQMPFELDPGIFADARAAPILLAGLLGGPIVGGITTLAAFAMRWYLGGAGALSGMVYILIIGTSGLAMHVWLTRRSSILRLGVAQAVWFMLIATTLTIPAVLLVPKENILPALFTMWPRMYIINLIGIAFAVSLISRESARIRLIEGLNNSNSLTTDVLDSIPAQVVILDQQGVIRRENRTWLEKATTVMNNPEKTFVDQDYLSVCFDAHDASGNPLIEAVHIGKGIQAVLNGQQNQFDAQYSMTHANKTQWYQLSAVRLHRSTETHRCAVLHFEISELVQSYQHLQTLKLNLENLVKERTLKLEEEVALREAAEIELRTYENAFKRSIEPMLITDDEFRILDVNPAYATLVESPQETLMNQLPSVLKLPQNGIDRVQVKRELEQNQYWQGQLNEVTPSGQTMSVIVSIAPILESDKTRYFITYFNITDRVKKEGVISKLAYQDALTGLNNRIALEQKIQTILSSAHRNKTMCAVIFIDLDDFKPVNDCYGHHIGDELLQMLASRLNDSIRENDIACRLGGDEFVLVLTEIEELDAIRKYVDQLSHELNTPYPVADYQITVTASIGVAVYPHHGREFSSLLSIADHAMYRSKALKNNYYIEPFPE